MENEQLAILHDHYKETFSYIRDRERQRDRLFLIAIGLLGVLATAVLFSTNFRAAVRSSRLAGTDVNLSALPIGTIIGTVWIFTLAITLRYCQISITVERQYSYLHKLEEAISVEFSTDGIYQREGKAYLVEFPAFSTWAWISYIFIFPVLAILVTVLLVGAEWLQLPSAWPYKLLDTVSGLAIIATLYLYRLTGPTRAIWSKIQALAVRQR